MRPSAARRLRACSLRRAHELDKFDEFYVLPAQRDRVAGGERR